MLGRKKQRKTEQEFEKLVRIFRKVALQDYSEKPDIPDAAIEKADPFTQLSVALRFMIDDLERSHADQQKSKELLQEERARLVASLDSLALGFMIVDKHGQVLMMNPIASKIFECEAPTQLEEIATKLDPSFKLLSHYKRVLQKGVAVDKTEVAIGSRVYHVYLAPIQLLQRSSIIGATVLVEDITEAKALERTRDEFFSIASHELRTPLTAIRGNASMILNFPVKKQDMNEMLADIQESATRLIEVVNDFLDASRLEQQRMSFKYEKFKLSEIIKDVAKEMQFEAKEKKITLHYDMEILQKLPDVWADPSRTKQIVYNLLGNAVKFTDGGKVAITAAEEGGLIRIMVSDTGRGISAENQRLLFHKFQQANTDLLTRDTTRGTGLGLYISRLIAENMGGHMGLAHSDIGKGSVFYFTLAIATDQDKHQAALPATH